MPRRGDAMAQRGCEQFASRAVGCPRFWRRAFSAFGAQFLRNERLRQRDGQSLLEWARAFLPKHFRLPPSGMHRWLDEQFAQFQTQRGCRINVIGPRGGAKSTVATLALVLRAALDGREPYIWIVSDSRHQAISHLENVKTELLENRRLAEAYPMVCSRGDIWRSGAIQLPNKTRIEAYGTGQRIRGRRRGRHRPTLIICDDIQNDQHMLSALQRERSLRWFHGALLKAGTKRTQIVNLATALHRDALALALHRTPGWNSRIFRAIERWPDNMALWQEWETIYTQVENPDHLAAARRFYDERAEAMTRGAELLWPEEEDLYTLMRMRVESGRAVFEREKQGAPLNPDLCEWPDEYFSGPLWFADWPERLSVKAIALDPSKGRDCDHSDYSAYVMLGIDDHGLIYVEADLARRPTPQMVTDGVELCRRFQPNLFVVEANQYQELLGGEFAAEFARAGVSGVAVWTLDNRTNKRVRIRRLGPYLSQRRLRFRDRSAATRLLVDQLRDFPHADHDDGPDALEMALRIATEYLEPTATTPCDGQTIREQPNVYGLG